MNKENLIQQIRNDIRLAILFAYTCDKSCPIEHFIKSVDESLAEQLDELNDLIYEEGFESGYNNILGNN